MADTRATTKTAPRKRELRKGVARVRRPTISWLLAHPATLPLLAIAVLFVVGASVVIVLSRGVPLASAGRIAQQTRLVRAEFEVVDDLATENKRNQAKALTPRVYNAVPAALNAIESSIATLPEVLASAATFDEVAPEVRESFALTAEQFESVRSRDASAPADESWDRSLADLMRLLSTTPLLAGTEHQVAINQSQAADLLLRSGDREEFILKSRAINIDTPSLDALTRLANDAGFFGPAAEVVVQRLSTKPVPTFAFDEAETTRRRDARAAAVPTQTIRFQPEDVLTVRGRTLDDGVVRLVQEEHRVFRARQGWGFHVARVGAITGGVAMIAAALVGAFILFFRRLVLPPREVGLLGGLMIVALAGSCWAALAYPALVLVAVTAPTAMVAVIAAVAHDRRLGLSVGVAQTALLAMALSLPLGVMATSIVGVGVGVWRLSSLRSRGDALRGSLAIGVSLLAASLVFGLLERSWAPGLLGELVSDAAWAGAGGFLAGSLTLVVLPTVERVFGATTGMTLAELRDPNRPLLRLLQREAPGTYNHSLNVASVAQSAAESIGADGLHVYVGALYHDVGKLNKPEYFIENQSGKSNKHASLSPAMSLLVIVGHVKDGVQLAREYRLPPELIHYVESHHGTTLVEYFYAQARKQADADTDVEAPEEIEYRYPGPKPRTREAAILMLSDAVESSARAMKEPTPARLEALVRNMANKRLLDGQFDECNLTLRELRTISDSLVKSLNAIYHGRIAYPKAEQPKTSGDPAVSRSAAS